MATQNEVATHLNIGERHVRRLVEDGILPGSRGRAGMDLDACRLAYISYLQGLSSGQVKPATETPTQAAGEEMDPLAEEKLLQARLRLTEAQAKAQELKNEVTEGRQASVEFMTFALGKVVPAISSTFDTLPMVMRRRHPDLLPRHLDTLEREATKIRNACAKFGDDLPAIFDEYQQMQEQ